MKKLIMFSLAAIVMLLFVPEQASAVAGNDPIGDAYTDPPEFGLMIGRLEEIKDMDVSMLARSEKRELRKEVRDIEKNLNALNGGGLYISVGAVILIVLILILLL
jgi:hypothetical protein